MSNLPQRRLEIHEQIDCPSKSEEKRDGLLVSHSSFLKKWRYWRSIKPFFISLLFLSSIFLIELLIKIQIDNKWGSRLQFWFVSFIVFTIKFKVKLFFNSLVCTCSELKHAWFSRNAEAFRHGISLHFSNVDIICFKELKRVTRIVYEPTNDLDLTLP